MDNNDYLNFLAEKHKFRFEFELRQSNLKASFDQMTFGPKLSHSGEFIVGDQSKAIYTELVNTKHSVIAIGVVIYKQTEIVKGRFEWQDKEVTNRYVYFFIDGSIDGVIKQIADQFKDNFPIDYK